MVSQWKQRQLFQFKKIESNRTIERERRGDQIFICIKLKFALLSAVCSSPSTAKKKLFNLYAQPYK